MSDRFENITIEDLYEFLEFGDMTKAPQELVDYMLMLEKIWGMHKRMFDFPNNESIITHLVLTQGYKRPKARQLLKDALEYFSRENQLSKETWRSIVAEKGMQSFVAGIRMARNSRDIKDSVWILLELGKFLGWDVPDAEKPDENFLRQMQIVTADIEMFDLPKVDRREIGRWIDALPEVSEKMKAKAKAEVDGVPFKLLKNMDNE